MNHSDFPRLASPAPLRARQRGAIALIVGLSMAVMIGFVGLAIDGGRLYLTKTELQNAADACALAASYELAGAPNIPAAAFTRADAAGVAVAQKNKVGFQATDIAAGEVTITYSNSLTGGWVSAGGAPADARYVRCVIQRTGITPYFMQVMGIGSQTVSALASASLSPAQTNCALPMALCVTGPAPDFGYVKGNWYGMDFRESGGNANYTGNFRWIDFDPSSPTPGCSGGGAQELACLIRGTGQCNLPPPTTSTCSTNGSSSPTPGCVGQNGAISAIESAFNSRFGLYKNGAGQPSAIDSPPDFSGNAYSTENWSLGRDAYNGASGGVPNFRSARAANLPTSNVAGVDPPFFSNPYNASSTATHASNGADRRIVIIPIVDCASFSSGQHAPVRAYACVLLLDPYRKATGSQVVTRVEYLGRSNEPGSPCASSGIAGNTTSQGPLVPALVQ